MDKNTMLTMEDFLSRSASHHDHLCPRQVLGVRMSMFAGTLLNLQLPQSDKRLLVIGETDGCFLDGISAVTNCTVGHRTLRIEDYGKVAATFYDMRMNTGWRIVPRPDIRLLARDFSPASASKWEKYLTGYQRMPDVLLFSVTRVELATPVQKIMSRPGLRTQCGKCGEEIMNERETGINGECLCRSCAGDSYYTVISSVEEPEVTACSHV